MAYASILSVMHKIDRLLHPSSHSKTKVVLAHTQLFQSTYDDLFSLEIILKEYTCEMMGNEMRFDPLELHIQEVADKVDDLLEAFVASSGESVSCHLLKLKQQITSFTDILREKKKSAEDAEKQRRTIDEAVPLRRVYDFGCMTAFVGLDAEVEPLMSSIVGGPQYLQVLSVFGMVGIGKTALVYKIYGHPHVRQCFDTFVWVTVGPNYRLHEFLLQFIDNAGIPIHVSYKEFGNDPYDLALEICKFLKGKRYLVVLDDVWSTNMLDEIERFFPNDGNCSRILLTSRLYHLAYYKGQHYRKRFLDDEQSWSLLRQTVFTSPDEHCQYELQKFGRKIAQNCEGLPLAILAVGKQLRTSEKTVEYWEEVSEQENIRDIIKDDYANIVESLALSYNMLPRRLKECFLYIGVVPNYKISVADLIKLWAVERFLPSQEDKRIEDVAVMSLSEVVSNSVVLIHEWSSQRRHAMKTCGIHFVFRSLCVTEAQKEKFCYVMRKYKYSFPRGMNLQERLSIHNNTILGIKEVRDTMESISSVRSLLCIGPQHPYPLQAHFSFRLLKVLHLLSIRFFEFPHQVLKLERLKYFALTYDGKLPESISQLWNLEVLIVGRYRSIISPKSRHYLPLQIWDLKWLKHLHCTGIDLLEGCESAVLKHLMTLTGVSARSCSQGILAKVPSLEKLGIVIELGPDEVETLSFFDGVTEQLHNLQSFKCSVLGRKSQLVHSTLSFPTTLRKLALSGCMFPWEYMRHISCLPHLEVLKLRCCAFSGPKWVIREGEMFHLLETFLLEDLDIEKWVAEGVTSTFPMLSHLMIKHCYKLHEMPMDIVHISTIKFIDLDDCRPCITSVVTQLIQEKKTHYPQVCIKESWDKKKLKSQS